MDFLFELWSKAWPVLMAIVFFGLIIFIHEFGHFFTAKLFGVKVNEFAIGMGPTLLKKQGKETLYSLKLFPIGGYCAMEGESEDSDDEHAYCNKKLWQRMIIIVAGATMNILLGVILCIGLCSADDLVSDNSVLQFYDGAVSSSETGLKEGDKIVEIDGKKVFSGYDLSFLMQRNESGKFHFVVNRDGEKIDLPEVNFARRTSGNFTFSPECVISGLSSKIRKEGLEENDKIVAVNGVKTPDSEALVAQIGADEDYIIDFTVIRNQGEIEVKDVKMQTITILDFVVLGKEKTVSSVIKEGLGSTLSMSRMVYLSLFDLLRGHYGINEISGPIGTISVITDMAATEEGQSVDWQTLFMMMALITINIGLFNLLPVPALDGGHFFFMLVELIFRKPVPEKFTRLVHGAGLVLLLIFMFFISAADLWKIISGTGFY